ncbi:MAG: hypothetical protein BMS9Abin01_0661 [Gammaproteobacteria bacterium]|nr:MAG: hypothetical protein BMS9Abin01_0661 [Gammaproteobacteria bacterium]
MNAVERLRQVHQIAREQQYVAGVHDHRHTAMTVTELVGPPEIGRAFAPPRQASSRSRRNTDQSTGSSAPTDALILTVMRSP